MDRCVSICELHEYRGTKRVKFCGDFPNITHASQTNARSSRNGAGRHLFWWKRHILDENPRPAAGINVSCVRGYSPAAHAVVRGITFYRIIIMIVGGILLLKQKFWWWSQRWPSTRLLGNCASTARPCRSRWTIWSRKDMSSVQSWVEKNGMSPVRRLCRWCSWLFSHRSADAVG